MNWQQEYAQLTEELRRHNAERYYHLYSGVANEHREPLDHDAIAGVIASAARRKLADTRRAALQRAVAAKRLRRAQQ